MLNCNSIESIDLSNIGGLEPSWGGSSQLSVGNNPLLSCLDLSNGYCTGWGLVNIGGNPLLTCVEVDNVTYSENATNWVYDLELNGNGQYSTNCGGCLSDITEINSQEKQLVKIVDLMGRETEYKPNTPLLYIYSEGTIERVFDMK